VGPLGALLALALAIKLTEAKDGSRPGDGRRRNVDAVPLPL